MGLIDRAKNILLTPKTEWDVIAAEPTPPAQIITGYVLPLAGIAALAHFISSAVIGHSLAFVGGTVRMPMMWALVFAVYQLVMAVVMIFVVGFVIDALAPSFSGQKNMNQAIKVAAYSYTAGWVGAVLGIIPYLGWLLAFLLGLYGLYLLYLGLPRLMKNPQDKSIGYTLVVIVCVIVLSIIVMFVGGLVTAPAMIAAGSYSSLGSSPNVTYEKDSTMGKLDQFAKKMEEAGKKMEAAQKSGDPAKQMEAAMATLGTAMSGGKGVEPVSIDQLKPFVPDKFAGLPRTDMRTERGGMPGFMVAKAEGIYGDAGGKSARLEVTDTGGAAGLMGLAAWMNIQGEREDANRREVTRKEGGRFIHEEVDKRGGNNVFTTVIADRYIVSAHGSVDINTLKSAVASLELGKLEAMKDATAPK